MKYFKYELQRGGSSLFVPYELNWFQKMLWRIKGYKIIKI